MSQFSGRVIVYGGKGALGTKCVSHFKANNWWVGSVDRNKNSEADLNVVVDRNDSWSKQETKVLSSVSQALMGLKLDAVICVAGGWIGGNANKDLIKNTDLMFHQSVGSSLIASVLAAEHLKEGGFVSLTGAQAATQPTPNMIGYGMAKAAVHQLAQSIGESEGGLPDKSVAVAILPTTLDTPMNRKWMPTADVSTWTPLEFIAELLMKWSSGSDRPTSGSLLKLVTNNFNTDIIPVEDSKRETTQEHKEYGTAVGGI